MSILTDLIPGGGLIDIAEKVIDHFVPDATEAQKAKDALAAANQSGELQQILGQIEINKEEAKSTNWFVAGWRPFVGWVCGMAFAYATVVEPLASWTAKVVFNYSGAFPILDTTITMQALFGMLGMGWYRSQDKKNGVQGNH